MGSNPIKKREDNLSRHSIKAQRTFEKDVLKIAVEVHKDLKKIKSKKKHNWIVHPTKAFFITVVILLILGMFFTQYFWFWVNSLDIFQSSSVQSERKFLLNFCNTGGIIKCSSDVFGNEILLSVKEGKIAVQNITLTACQGYTLKSNNLVKLHGCYISPHANNFNIILTYINIDSDLSHKLTVNVIKQLEISWIVNLRPEKDQ